ncbi:hypothetical protein HYD83_00895 [Mycoplasmopsis bovis]|nr:hypothetical protein [Mycoplasmopsis bovis]QQH37274.1 hypothetical protein HYD83_00895 [Mycoplasmopsis bovis]
MLLEPIMDVSVIQLPLITMIYWAMITRRRGQIQERKYRNDKGTKNLLCLTTYYC